MGGIDRADLKGKPNVMLGASNDSNIKSSINEAKGNAHARLND